jgi:transcriptional regulator with XRE-family HTH domain
MNPLDPPLYEIEFYADESGQMPCLRWMKEEQEAHEEGPEAVRELEQFREEFSLASQLIESRREGRLSQRDLAKLSGVPQSEISRIETGASNPTYATITSLLRPLGKRIELVDNGPITARRVSGDRTQSTKRTSAAKKASRRRKPAARKTAAKAS